MVSAVLGLRPDQVRRALEAACRAPSLFNSQPWAFLLTDDHIELHLDTRRLLPSADPERRQALIACGGALFNLRMALADLGVAVDARIWPDGPRGPVARVGRAGQARPNQRWAELDRAIPHRRSNHRPFFAVPVPIRFQEALSHAAAMEGASLHLTSQRDWLERLRGWTADAHLHQRQDPAWMRDRARWPDDAGPRDATSAILRSESGRWAAVDDDRRPPEDGGDPGDHPLIGILTTITDTARRQVVAGLALERTLLSATGLGLSMSTLPELIEFGPARRQLGLLLGTEDFPQAVVRLGFDGPVRPSGRRPLQDSLIDAPLTTAGR